MLADTYGVPQGAMFSDFLSAIRSTAQRQSDHENRILAVNTEAAHARIQARQHTHTHAYLQEMGNEQI